MLRERFRVVRSLSMAAGSVLLMSTGVHAAPYVWDGGQGTSVWSDAANWNPDGTPGTGDDVSVTTSADVDLDGPRQIQSLVLGDPSGIQVNVNVTNSGSGGLTFDSFAAPAGTGQVRLQAGTLNIDVPLTFNLPTAPKTIFHIDWRTGSYNIAGSVDLGNTPSLTSQPLLVSFASNSTADIVFSDAISGTIDGQRLVLSSSVNRSNGSVKYAGANTFTAPLGLYVNPAEAYLGEKHAILLAHNSALGNAANVLNLGQSDVGSADDTALKVDRVLITDSADTIANHVATRMTGIWEIGSDKVGTATWSGNITMGRGTTLNAPAPIRLTAETANTVTQFTGVLATGGGANPAIPNVEIVGPGKVVLTNTNTYLGATTVVSGTLVVDGTLSNTPSVTVSSGAALEGEGTISNALIVNGDVNPGNGIGILSVGSANFGAGGILGIEMNSTSTDTLAVSGLLDISNAVLNLSGVAPTSGSFVIASYGSLTGSQFASVTGLPDGASIDYGTGTNSSIILTVPEPSVLGLASLGVLALRRRYR